MRNENAEFRPNIKLPKKFNLLEMRLNPFDCGGKSMSLDDKILRIPLILATPIVIVQELLQQRKEERNRRPFTLDQ